jgi:hypothetical protein
MSVVCNELFAKSCLAVKCEYGLRDAIHELGCCEGFVHQERTSLLPVVSIDKPCSLNGLPLSNKAILIQLGGADDQKQINLLTLVQALLVERGLGKEGNRLCKAYTNVLV